MTQRHILVRSNANPEPAHGAERLPREQIAGVKRLLLGLAGSLQESYRLAADIQAIAVEGISVETEAGVAWQPSGLRYSSFHARVRLRGLSDTADAERMRAFVEHLAPVDQVFRGLKTELIIAPLSPPEHRTRHNERSCTGATRS